MSSFKQHLKENELLTEAEEKSVLGLIAYRAIPLEPGLMRRLGYYIEDQEAFHLTNSVHLPKMANLQGKRNVHLSTFTRGGNELARLPSQPNILLKLRGDTVIEGDTDIWTIVSVRGRRWLDIRDRKLTGGDSKKLTKYITGVIQSSLDSQGIKYDAYQNQPEELIKVLEKLNSKTLLRLYKTYLTKLEAMLNKEYKLLNTYLRTAAEMAYNEVILTKWKILELWSIDWDRPDVRVMADDLKIPYSGVVMTKDFKNLKV